MKKLKAGQFFWYKQKAEGIWRPCYIGQDHDKNLYLHDFNQVYLVKDMILAQFDFVEIFPPI